jgi:NAD-dependent DNA ligase
MILENIEKSKNAGLAQFLGAIGIDLLGRRRVEILAKDLGLRTIEDWLDESKLGKIPGDVMRESIIAGINKARPIINDLIAAGVKPAPIVDKKHQKTSDDLAGKPDLVVEAETIHISEQDTNKPALAPGSQIAGRMDGISCCWTGTRAYVDEFEAAGGTVKSGISKGLHLLVQKDPTSSSNKTKKAESYGTKIIGIETLKRLVDGLISPSDLGLF